MSHEHIANDSEIRISRISIDLLGNQIDIRTRYRRSLRFWSANFPRLVRLSSSPVQQTCQVPCQVPVKFLKAFFFTQKSTTLLLKRISRTVSRAFLRCEDNNCTCLFIQVWYLSVRAKKDKFYSRVKKFSLDKKKRRKQFNVVRMREEADPIAIDENIKITESLQESLKETEEKPVFYKYHSKHAKLFPELYRSDVSIHPSYTGLKSLP